MSDGRRGFARKELRKVIELVREMPNADDRYNKLCKGLIPKMLDGGSVHRFTLIDLIEKEIKKLEGEVG